MIDESETHFEPAKSGRFQTYLASCPQKNDFFVKVYPFKENQISTNYLNEKRFSQLTHPNIVTFKNCHDRLDLIYNEYESKCSGIFFEYAQNGDFFDLIVQKRVIMNDKLVRTFFRQLIAGVEHLHKNNVAHLDIKLDNLLLTEDFTLKVADFDLSCFRDEEIVSSKGSKYFRAPEIIVGCSVDHAASDIFSIGVILFTLKARGLLPQLEENKKNGVDLYYLMRNDQPKFWEVHQATLKKKEDFFSEDFKKLFLALTNGNPKQRPTVSEIKEFEWFKGPVYSQEELAVVMNKKLNLANSS